MEVKQLKPQKQPRAKVKWNETSLAVCLQSEWKKWGLLGSKIGESKLTNVTRWMHLNKWTASDIDNCYVFFVLSQRWHAGSFGKFTRQAAVLPQVTSGRGRSSITVTTAAAHGQIPGRSSHQSCAWRTHTQNPVNIRLQETLSIVQPHNIIEMDFRCIYWLVVWSF